MYLAEKASEQTFKDLFKRYRLRSEFETLAEFGEALNEKGITYDDSIYSHWQKGTRLPSQRFVMLKLLEIFIERDAIQSIDEANDFLCSAGMGYLTKNELLLLNLGNE